MLTGAYEEKDLGGLKPGEIGTVPDGGAMGLYTRGNAHVGARLTSYCFFPEKSGRYTAALLQDRAGIW